MISRISQRFHASLRAHLKGQAQRTHSLIKTNAFGFGDSQPMKQPQSKEGRDKDGDEERDEERADNMRVIWDELNISSYEDIYRKSDKERHRITAELQTVKEKLVAKIQEEIAEIESRNELANKYLTSLELSSRVIQAELLQIIQTLQEYTLSIEAAPIAELTSKHQLLSEMLKLIHSQRPQDGNRIIPKLAFVIEAQIKLRIMVAYFKQYNHASDITNSHPSSFPEVWKRISVKRTSNHSQIDKDYNTLGIIFHIASGAIMRAEKYSQSITKQIAFSLSFPMNVIRYQWSLLNSLTLFRDPSIENARKLLNLYEDGFLKKATEFGFMRIKTNKMIYIPAEGEFEQGLDLFQERKNTIPVRILYSKELPLVQSNQEYIEDAIVHIHGGGFVALSSHTTQNHTRQWANSLQIPVFSIDYRMPPDHPYPQAPYDCLRAYKFLTSELHKYFRFRPRNILISGDSAGGNLTCGLTALILKQKLIKPLGLYIVYPSLDLRLIYYPSRKYIINDPLLWPSMVVLFLKSYVRQYDQVFEPLASPLLLTEQFVSGSENDVRFPLNWPRTHITVGIKDPLRDESLLLMQKMVESGIDCKCILYEHMSHGYLATEKIIKESTITIKDSIADLKGLLEIGKNQQKDL